MRVMKEQIFNNILNWFEACNRQRLLRELNGCQQKKLGLGFNEEPREVEREVAVVGWYGTAWD